MSAWKPCPQPERLVLEGRFCRLQPLSVEAHGDDLFAAATAEDADERFRWLPEVTPATRVEFDEWMANAAASDDPLFFAVIDKRTSRAEGRQTLMRIDPANGVIEVGNVFWGGAISRSPVTTEAYFLFAQYVFDVLGYRRFEWKCNNRNGPSKRAAERFGMTFEGVFRQALVVKGENRDTAWYSLLDREWPATKARFERWLAPENFDSQGRQIATLNEI
ncbi:GNAT family N-acetyltransferase [Pseudahrensia aquimaris]|uniref:GNAT family N-acetyltransferase n=1 Tax=Pseudahrensia aquimaris TaxID=744461 RepID=A0ABW3FEU7_9HYPH